MFINILPQKIIMFSFPDLCRLCLSSVNLKFQLESADSDNITLHAKLKWLEPNILEPDGFLPSLICETCNEKLCQAYTFKEQCLQSCEKLRVYAREILEVTSGQEANEVKQEVDEHLKNSKPEANSDDDNTTSDYICKTEIIDTNDSESELPDYLSVAIEDNKYLNRKSKTGYVNRLGAVRSEDNCFEYTLQIGDTENVVYVSNFKENIFSCTKCQKCYKNFSSLRKHLLGHSKQKPNKNEICKETYTEPALNSHKTSHQEDSCESEVNYSDSELSDSLLVTTKRKKSTEKICQKNNSGLESALNSHKISQQGDAINDSESELSDSLLTSKRNHFTKKKKYQKINSGFVNKLGAVRSENNRSEYTLQISDSEKVVYISNYKEQIFCCTNCKKNYTNFSSLRKHLLVHSKEKNYKCDICGKETYTKGALNSHKITHLEGRGSEICKDCGKSFKSKDRLRVHYQCHNKSYVCDTCGKLFSTVSTLKKHIICAHSNKRDFICTICGFAAKTPDYLKRHMSKHSTEKTFKCEVCKKLLKNRSTFNIHMKRHANNRKHVCHICNKSFVVKGQYDVHFRIHSNEKPYLCNYCGKRFRRQDHYKNHVRIHTNEKPYACDTCGKAFTQKISLVLHQKTHEKKKSFHCEYCSKYFSQDSKYQNHLVVCMSP